ncbi:hypothetical protein IJ541_01340 [bacterium]|nr:hypothetical protein [bacterium]
MAQEFDLIVDMLREMKRANTGASESFDKLLSEIGRKVDAMDKNFASADLVKSYIADLARSYEDKYNTTIAKFTDIENALKTIFNEQNSHAKIRDMRELFDVFSQNLNNFYAESLQQKSLLTGIENRLADIGSDKSDKDDIVRTITLLRSDFENLNHGYKNTIDIVNSDLKTIISNLMKLDQTAVNLQIKEQVETMYRTIGDIVNYLKSNDKREENLEKLLSGVATSDNLKFTHSIVEAILNRSESISEKLTTLANKSDIDDLNTQSQTMFSKVSSDSEHLIAKTDEVKSVLATLSKNIDTLPDTQYLEKALQNVFNTLKDIETDISSINVKDNVVELDAKLGEFNSELLTIKNIITDLNDAVNSKVLNAIESISFENESYDIKEHVSKMLANLPQKKDIEKILENNELSKSSIEDLIQKADKLADRLDNLPTHDDMAGLNSNQLSLVENLQGVANKEDVENLSSKADEIEQMIDKLNFDSEFENIYDKSVSIEKWLADSKVKENSEEILEKLSDKAEQKDVIDILKTAEQIVNNIDELSKNVDIKKVNRTVAEVYQLIEDLKNDFLNTTEMHNDNIIVSLSELQKSISNIVSGEEFESFVEDLKNFVDKTVQDTNNVTENIDEIKTYQETILSKLSEINMSALEDVLNEKVSTLDEKLVSISDYLTNVNKIDSNEVKQAISEIKDILEAKKAGINEFEGVRQETIDAIEAYLKEIKVILDTSDREQDDEVKNKISSLEEKLSDYQISGENTLNTIISKLDAYRSDISDEYGVKSDDLTSSIGEISEIKEKLIALGDSFKNLNVGKEGGYAASFVSEKLSELASNLDNLTDNIEAKLQQGFAYNAQLIEEKTDCLLDFIKELRHESTKDIGLYERLTVADNKLADYKQELSLVNTDVIENLSTNSDKLMTCLSEIKDMLSNSSSAIPEKEIKENIVDLHDSVNTDLEEFTKYSKTTFEKLEDTYNKISNDLTNTENNLRDFILSDVDSVIIKLDNLREEVEAGMGRIVPPEASQMAEFKKFADGINEFRQEQKRNLEEVAKDIKTSVTEQLVLHHEELKSMLTVSVNNKEIIDAIESLKKCFKDKSKALSEIQDLEDTDDDVFETNQYDKAFETDKNSEIIESLKNDFDKFSTLIGSLSDDNSEIEEVLNLIKSKMESISVVKNASPEIVEDEEQTDMNAKLEIDSDSDGDTDSDSEDDNDEDGETIVGAGNFDFVKALDLLKNDIRNLHDEISKIIPAEEQKQTASTLASIPTLGKDNLLLSLNNKIELLAKAVNPKEWLEEIKTYLTGEQIHTMLEQISGKIDILTLSDNTEWIKEIKQALEQLNNSEPAVTSDPKLQSMLSLINNKIDIIAASDDYGLMEEVREAIENINVENNEETNKLLNLLNSKMDILASSDNIDDFEDIKDLLNSIDEKLNSGDNIENFENIKAVLNSIEEKINSSSTVKDFVEVKDLLASIDDKLDSDTFADDFEELRESLKVIENKLDIVASTDFSADFDDIRYTLADVDEKFESVKKLSVADEKITNILETLNQKVDAIGDVKELPIATLQEIQDIKDLIMAQTDYIESFEKNNKTDALRKCLQELTDEVNSLNSTSGTKVIQRTIKEMKESIMAAVVTIFDQINFIEESEDIKDFVEEKTDEINQNLVEVTNRLKQITNSADDEPDYTYSMQDIESDLAKLRLALNQLQENEQENQSARLSSLLENINQVGESVVNLQNSLTTEEVFGLKSQFDKINADITGLNELTNRLIEKSGESYNTLNNNFVDFGKNITDQLTTKVDRVTKLLEKSNDSDKVMRQALIYMGEWIDSASESMNKISTNSDEIVDIKSAIEALKKSIPEQTELLSSLSEKFDEQQERLAFFEKQISKIALFEDRFEEQQERIDRLEMSLEKILSAVEDIDDSKVTRKIDKIDKQIAKLSTNIEKLASYVD